MSSQTLDPKAVREFLFARAAEAAREGKPAADKAFTHAAELLLEDEPIRLAPAARMKGIRGGYIRHRVG